MRYKDDEIFEFIAINFSHNVHRIDFDYHFWMIESEIICFLHENSYDILICIYFFVKIMNNVI
jgi:hypothetical protein